MLGGRFPKENRLWRIDMEIGHKWNCFRRV